MENADVVILNRLRLLDEYISDLKGWRNSVTGLRVYAEDKTLHYAVERCLQVAIEICLDVGRRLIAVRGFRYPEDNQDVFRILAAESVVSEELLPALLEMARFRNLLVHDYARIDDGRVYAILKDRLGDFDAFAAQLVTYLQGTN